MNINCENNVKKVLTIQIVVLYLYQANELTTTLDKRHTWGIQLRLLVLAVTATETR
mgnify:FL=1|jgi:hypothetical protein